jgi:hypothetical protein
MDLRGEREKRRKRKNGMDEWEMGKSLQKTHRSTSV